MIDCKATNPKQMKGFILITTLILVCLLTIIAVTGISLSNNQTRMAANAKDNEISFEKAQAALQQATNLIFNGTYNPTTFIKNASGFYLYDRDNQPKWKTINWSNAADVVTSFKGNTRSAASYIIEKLPSVFQPGQNSRVPSHVYRITAYATDRNTGSSVILQNTISVQ
ncbi:MAG: pilus assembly PilX family protein [Legionella sp.]